MNSIEFKPRRSWHAVGLAILLAALSASAADSSPQIVNDDPTRRVDIRKALGDLHQAWTNSSVASLFVVHIPTNRYYPVSVSTSQIDARPAFRLMIDDAKASPIAKALVSRLMTEQIVSTNRVADLCWGFIFSSPENDRILSIYLDETGRHGVLNGACVMLESEAVKNMAEKWFSTAFQ